MTALDPDTHSIGICGRAAVPHQSRKRKAPLMRARVFPPRRLIVAGRFGNPHVVAHPTQHAWQRLPDFIRCSAFL